MNVLEHLELVMGHSREKTKGPGSAMTMKNPRPHEFFQPTKWFAGCSWMSDNQIVFVDVQATCVDHSDSHGRSRRPFP